MVHAQKAQDKGKGKAAKRKPLVIGFAGGVLATLAVAFAVAADGFEVAHHESK